MLYYSQEPYSQIQQQRTLADHDSTVTGYYLLASSHTWTRLQVSFITGAVDHC